MSALATVVSLTTTVVLLATVIVPTVILRKDGDERAKAEAKGEPIEDRRRLIDWRRVVIDRRGIGRRRSRVAVPVGSIVVPRRTALCTCGPSEGPCTEG
jgi:hypothetical protein